MNLCLAIATVLLLGLALVIAVRPHWLRLKQYMKLLRTPGFVPPPPTVRGLRWQLRLTRLLTWVFVGRVKVRGQENFAKLPAGASYQITPNHSHFADIFVVPMVVNDRKARYMADPAVMGGFGGLFGLIVAKMGAFAASREAAMKVLLAGEAQVIFPEGWTYLDGNMGRYRNGAVNFSRKAATQLKQESYLVPMYVRYGRYPGAWILKYPIRVQYAILVLGFLYFRSGATVVIGEPIPSANLPGSDKEASETLRAETLKLKP